ncbi:hypothetical protein PCH_Pc22g12910 [Penicillium rubens Wisconsin 54-1255]|uniref:Uncharacterized protein n=1 Tax=Penicillium rubens (strain ATCC 28089 / DSM 1075 / NRRL 1951 / Wisconsin 54-1255) TaxID=500485 RepID=B6HSC5_PENRW|nr:hypothetical protein PCH_Pc22g12910 [Penicillium rubens Wisconsin 54-1255]
MERYIRPTTKVLLKLLLKLCAHTSIHPATFRRLHFPILTLMEYVLEGRGRDRLQEVIERIPVFGHLATLTKPRHGTRHTALSPSILKYQRGSKKSAYTAIFEIRYTTIHSRVDPQNPSQKHAKYGMAVDPSLPRIDLVFYVTFVRPP